MSGAATIAALAFGLDYADRAYPPPVAVAETVSKEVLDRDGRLLRAFATPEGHWRLKTTAADVDPQFLRMLVAYEDRRFEEHPASTLALLRAAGQFVTNGRIVSGASTLSMQVARLIEPRENRSMLAKLRQMARAIQLERRLSKAEILDLYLTLAPYGGNLEGVRAASLAWFGKEPKRLSVAEAALLVALPQLPEKRRPDRHRDVAEKARARVLTRMAVSGSSARARRNAPAPKPCPTAAASSPPMPRIFPNWRCARTRRRPSTGHPSTAPCRTASKPSPARRPNGSGRKSPSPW